MAETRYPIPAESRPRDSGFLARLLGWQYSAMSGSVTFAQFDSIDAQAEQLVGFDQHYQQLEPGNYSGAFLTDEVGDLSLAVEQTNRALHQVGAGASGHLTAVFLMQEGEQQSRVNGQEFTSGDVLLIPAGSEYESVIMAGAVPAVISIPAAPDPDRGAASGCDLSIVRRTTNARLAADFRSVVRNAIPNSEPATPSDRPPRSIAQTEEVGRALMTRLRCEVSGDATRSYHTFRWARSILISDLSVDTSIGELARAVGVSRRTLDASFLASVGVSPARFRKLLRLNRARRLLQTGQHSVTSAASMSGLHHLGRFSNDYRALFSELPSTTRARHVNAVAT